MTTDDTIDDTTGQHHAPLPVLQDVCYRGVQPPRGGPGLITVWTLTGGQIGTLPHFPKHSPTGMAWGYPGSGAADCARSLLAAAIGEQLAVCLVCRGTAKVVFAENRPPRDTDATSAIRTCVLCDAGLALPPRIYQEYKDVFVATWPDEFVTTRGAIVGWLKHRFPEHNWPTVID